MIIAFPSQQKANGVQRPCDWRAWRQLREGEAVQPGDLFLVLSSGLLFESSAARVSSASHPHFRKPAQGPQLIAKRCEAVPEIGQPVAMRLDFLFVPEADRGTGIGSRMYREWEAALPSDVAEVCLYAGEVGPNEPATAEFWLKMGFSFRYEGRDLPEGSAFAMRKGVNGIPTQAPLCLFTPRPYRP
jgi:GNAT superfamily N-acetyltransferase